MFETTNQTWSSHWVLISYAHSSKSRMWGSSKASGGTCKAPGLPFFAAFAFAGAPPPDGRFGITWLKWYKPTLVGQLCEWMRITRNILWMVDHAQTAPLGEHTILCRITTRSCTKPVGFQGDTQVFGGRISKPVGPGELPGVLCRITTRSCTKPMVKRGARFVKNSLCTKCISEKPTMHKTSSFHSRSFSPRDLLKATGSLLEPHRTLASYKGPRCFKSRYCMAKMFAIFLMCFCRWAPAFAIPPQSYWCTDSCIASVTIWMASDMLTPFIHSWDAALYSACWLRAFLYLLASSAEGLSLTNCSRFGTSRTEGHRCFFYHIWWHQINDYHGAIWRQMYVTDQICSGWLSLWRLPSTVLAPLARQLTAPWWHHTAAKPSGTQGGETSTSRM